MEKTKFKHLFIGLIVILTFCLSLSIAFAADDNVSVNNTISDSNGGVGSDTTNNVVNKNTSKPSSLSQSSILAAAKSVNNYVTKNKRLPDSITISKYKFSMPEFLYLMSKTISNKYKKINSAVKIKYDIKDPSNPTGVGSKGKIYSVYYNKYANKIVDYATKYKKIPNYIMTAGGNKLQYQSVIFLFAKVLSSTKSNKLPYYVSVNIRSSTPFNQYMPTYNRYASFTSKSLGKDEKGYVDFLTLVGNPSSNVKIAYIIGVHPLEKNAHSSLYTNLLANAKNLRYKYYIYRVTVTDQASDYANGRMNGQLLAQKYILPHIKANKYNLVIDVHANQGTKGGNYKKTNFIFAPLNNATSKTIANKIIKNIPGLSYYFPESQTSPHYYTNPLVQSGVKTIIYETYMYETKATTDKYMKQLITTIDDLKL